MLTLSLCTKILVTEICMKDRKCHPITKMCRHCGSRQPPPYSRCLVLHHQHPRDQAAIRHISCKRGCCCASSYSSCSFLYTYLLKASNPSISLLHPTVTAVPPSSIPAASLHLPNTLHPPYIRLLTPVLPVLTCP